MIRDGRVTVDDRPAHLGQKVDPRTARVAVDGIPLPVRPDLVHYLLYKPVGVISTADDPQGRPAVVELVPEHPRVYPVGRLDADSEGLMILTNDGDLANHVMHPSHGVTKTYVARVAGNPGDGAMAQLRAGVELDDGSARAHAARVLSSTSTEALVEIVMGEGRNREVRRMLAAVGHDVTALVRTAIGPITDRRLTAGEWRRLSTIEVRDLYGVGSSPR